MCISSANLANAMVDLIVLDASLCAGYKIPSFPGRQEVQVNCVLVVIY